MANATDKLINAGDLLSSLFLYFAESALVAHRITESASKWKDADALSSSAWGTLIAARELDEEYTNRWELNTLEDAVRIHNLAIKLMVYVRELLSMLRKRRQVKSVAAYSEQLERILRELDYRIPTHEHVHLEVGEYVMQGSMEGVIVEIPQDSTQVVIETSQGSRERMRIISSCHATATLEDSKADQTIPTEKEVRNANMAVAGHWHQSTDGIHSHPGLDYGTWNKIAFALLNALEIWGSCPMGAMQITQVAVFANCMDLECTANRQWVAGCLSFLSDPMHGLPFSWTHGVTGENMRSAMNAEDTGDYMARFALSSAAAILHQSPEAIRATLKNKVVNPNRSCVKRSLDNHTLQHHARKGLDRKPTSN